VDWKVQLHPKHNQVAKNKHKKYIINKKTCKKCLIEVLACPCKHLGVIKYLIIHLETMEAYTLWWNGGIVQKCWIKTQNTDPLWTIECYCGKGDPIWKGKHDLSPLGKIVWRWHGHPWTSWDDANFLLANFWHMLHEFDEPFTSLIGVFLECLKHHGVRLSFIESLEVNELWQTHVMITLTHVVLCWNISYYSNLAWQLLHGWCIMM
jgi:hypothetical protein